MVAKNGRERIVLTRASAPDEPHDGKPDGGGNRAAHAQLRFRGGGRGLQQPSAKAGSQSPERAFDHQHQAESHCEIVHRALLRLLWLAHDGTAIARVYASSRRHWKVGMLLTLLEGIGLGFGLRRRARRRL